MLKLYLAGPDVFRPDALSWAENARQSVAALGHRALIPLDNEATTAAGIFEANLALISEADVVVANLNPFRGAEPDSGTAFEIGCAIALGKRAIAYLDDTRPQVDKLADWYGQALPHVDGRCFDPTGLAVENFGLPVNLMLAVPCTWVRGTLEDALRVL